jgi:hypothetical protein
VAKTKALPETPDTSRVLRRLALVGGMEKERWKVWEHAGAERALSQNKQASRTPDEDERALGRSGHQSSKRLSMIFSAASAEWAQQLEEARLELQVAKMGRRTDLASTSTREVEHKEKEYASSGV